MASMRPLTMRTSAARAGAPVPSMTLALTMSVAGDWASAAGGELRTAMVVTRSERRMNQKMAHGFRAGKWRRQCTRPSVQIPYEFARARDADDYELPVPDMMRHSFVILLTVGALACSAARTLTPLSGTSAAITEDDLRHRLYLIADDS